MTMRFSVASWHSRPIDEWLANPNAFTTMCSPPHWAKEHRRNLDIFAPPRHIVFGTDVTEELYRKVYGGTLKGRLNSIKQWIAAHEHDHVILMCACPDGQFCHRHLLAKALIWMGCEQVDIPEPEVNGIRVVSLWQPWASLISVGAKQIETRHWKAPKNLIGKRIAIHAAKHWDRETQLLCMKEPFCLDLPSGTLPLGAVVATAILAECRSTDDESWVSKLSPRERCYGNYGPGRYGWLLTDIKRLASPIPLKGRQGIWVWQPEEGLDVA